MTAAPVAVVVVSWNSAGWLTGCLESLRGLVRPPAEVVVVDNGSADGTPALVRRAFPEVRLLEAGDNVGYCRANNLGIAGTSSPFVLLLNPDTALDPGYLEALLPAFDDPRVGIAAGKLLRFDRVTLDSAGQVLGRSRQPIDRGYGQPDRGQFDRDCQVFGACGAAALLRRSMLDALAGPALAYFDEGYFAFYEDLDLAWRAQRAGWSAVYRHHAIGYHARGGTAVHPSVGRRFRALLGRSPEVRFHVLKNRWLTMLRNDTPGAWLRNAPFIVTRDAAMLGAVLVTSPGVLFRLWRARAHFREALRSRRLDFMKRKHHTSASR